MKKKYEAIIIGGGISGLSVAHELRRRGVEDILVLESNSVLGGRLRTLELENGEIELGAAFVSEFFENSISQLERLNIDVTSQHTSLGTRVYLDGESKPVWPLRDLLRQGPLSRQSLIRLGFGGIGALALRWPYLSLEDLSASARFDKESVEEWARRVLGRETAEHFIAPLLQGLLYWDSSDASAAVLLVMLKAALVRSKSFRVPGGMSAWINALAEAIGHESIYCDAEVVRVGRADDGCHRVVFRADTGLRSVEAPLVACATTASLATQICRDLPEPVRQALRGSGYSRTAIGVFRTPRSLMSRETLVFPPGSGSIIASINPQDSSETRINADYLKICLSAKGYSRLAALDDTSILQVMLSEARRMKALGESLDQAEPCRLQRWQEALPLFAVGWLRELQMVKAAALPQGLALAGDYMEAPCIEGAVRSGVLAADRLLQQAGRR